MTGAIAILDACVLHPAPLRDLLLRVSSTGAYRARFTDQLHEEWIDSVLARRPHLARARLERTRQLMNAHALDCLVAGYEALIETLSLPDPDDRHVLAAAIHCGASAIVTLNTRDFPARSLKPFRMEAIRPDTLLLRLWECDAEAIVDAARAQRRALQHPPNSIPDFLDTLQRQGLADTAALLAKRADEL